MIKKQGSYITKYKHSPLYNILLRFPQILKLIEDQVQKTRRLFLDNS